MNYFSSKLSKGFTLMELLVVISIIGLLASVVLSTLSTARQKGRNSARVQQIQQYTKALELYRSVNDKYPSHDLVLGPWTCLGDYGNLSCWSPYVTDLAFKAKMLPYISFPQIQLVAGMGGLYRSISPYTTYSITWFMEGGDGTNPYCQIAGATYVSMSGVNQRCNYSPQ